MLRLTALLLFLPVLVFSQDTVSADSSSFFAPSRSFNAKRTWIVAGTETALAGGNLVVLNSFWYRNYPRSSFHFFNDNSEWLQMDKAGHVLTCYYTGRIGMNLLRWGGVEGKKSIWFGGLTGFVFQGTIEMLDAYSAQWGFSTGDLAANTLGAGLLIGQEYAWKEQRITLKFSSHRTDFPVYRPDLLGRTRMEQIIKDYNGQTIWISANIAAFLKKETKIPGWLNLAFGYSAEGMTGGRENAPVYNASGNAVDFPRYRQYYLSLDVDLTRLPGQSPFVKMLTGAFGFIKIPAPALAFDRQGFGAYWLYY